MLESRSHSDVPLSLHGLLLVVPLVLAMPWACRERVMEVLGPAPSHAPISSNAPPASAGAANHVPGEAIAGTGDGTQVPNPGTQPAVLPPTCDAAFGLGATCTSSNDCCSGFCGTHGSTELYCQSAVGCSAVGTPCTRAGECCSLACVATGNGRVCADLGYCSPIGEACAAASDCCSTRCEGELCATPTPPGCSSAGELCANANACCSTVCANGTDGRARCQLLEACRVEGESCAAAADCCSGLCQNHPSGIARCAVEKKCGQGDRKDCTRQVGELCKNAEECCSGACVRRAGGASRCAPLGACRAVCEGCNRNSDCCSGTCQADADGAGHCMGGACLLEGEICGNTQDCCQTDFAQSCVEDLPGLKVKHCRRDPPPLECLPSGEGCALSSLCCDGICSQDESLEFRCANYCRTDGQHCSSSIDCCGQYSDCVSLKGERICATIGTSN